MQHIESMDTVNEKYSTRVPCSPRSQPDKNHVISLSNQPHHLVHSSNVSLFNLEPYLYFLMLDLMYIIGILETFGITFSATYFRKFKKV